MSSGKGVRATKKEAWKSECEWTDGKMRNNGPAKFLFEHVDTKTRRCQSSTTSCCSIRPASSAFSPPRGVIFAPVQDREWRVDQGSEAACQKICGMRLSIDMLGLGTPKCPQQTCRSLHKPHPSDEPRAGIYPAIVGELHPTSRSPHWP